MPTISLDGWDNAGLPSGLEFGSVYVEPDGGLRRTHESRYIAGFRRARPAGY